MPAPVSGSEIKLAAGEEPAEGVEPPAREKGPIPILPILAEIPRMASPAARVYRRRSGGWVGLRLKKGKVPSAGPAANLPRRRRQKPAKRRNLGAATGPANN